VREGGPGGTELRVVPSEPEAAATTAAGEGGTAVGAVEVAGVRRPPVRRLPEPGVLELEELLSTYLNTRVKVDIQNRRGRLVVEFATLEDLERIYRAMVGEGGVT